MVEISVSVLNVEENIALQSFHNLEVARTDYYHIDVMDGKFVPKDTTKKMKEYATYIKQISNIPLDVHLMVENVKEYVEEYLPLEPNVITFHIEAVGGSQATGLINYLKENNVKVGLCIKPSTKVEDIYKYLPYIHMVLVMTVEPGLGGQRLIPETLEKVKILKQYIDEKNLSIDIEVDGGINKETVGLAKEAGANILVAGTAIVKAEDYKKAIEELKTI